MAHRSDDPHERLMQAGNELLDTLFELRDWPEYRKRLEEAKGDSVAAKALLDEPGLAEMLKYMTLTNRHEALLNEYTSLRLALEHSTAEQSIDWGVQPPEAQAR